MLEIESLNVCVENFALKDINISLQEGEILGIVGESGSGKTLLSYLILRLLEHYRVQSGRITFLGKNLLGLSQLQMQALRGKEISYIFQEPLSALNPLHKIKKQIKEAIMIHNPNITQDTLRNRIAELLENVQLPNSVLESYPYALSGGQRQRVCIAIALANNPKILIADEPTTALDSTTQAQILELLKMLQKKFKLSIVFISHNLAVVSRLCEKIVVMQKGKIIEQGDTQRIFRNPKNSYTKMLFDALRLHYNKGTYGKELVLQVQDLSVKYPTKKSFLGKTLESFVALKPLSFALHKGESVGIIGESGSGKSSLANALCRILEAEYTSGRVELLGRDFFAMRGNALRMERANIQMIFQDPFSSLNPKMQIFQILKEGLETHFKLDKKSMQEKIKATLNDVGLEEKFLWRYPNELSGGQRQRVSIARSLILRPKVMILDEPTSALDCATQNQILNLLLKLAKQYGLSYLCISHDLNVIATLCQNVLVLRQGEMLEYGATSAVFKAPKHPYVRELLEASAVVGIGL